MRNIQIDAVYELFHSLSRENLFLEIRCIAKHLFTSNKNANSANVPGNLNINGVPMSRISAIYTAIRSSARPRLLLRCCTASDLTFHNRRASVNELCNVHVRINNFIQNRILILSL